MAKNSPRAFKAVLGQERTYSCITSKILKYLFILTTLLTPIFIYFHVIQSTKDLKRETLYKAHKIKTAIESEFRYVHDITEFISKIGPKAQTIHIDTKKINKNNFLEYYAKIFQVSVCYMMDTAGLVIATSNWKQSNSFLGKNYGFRPYFKDAIEFGKGEYFAQGVTSNKKGFYASRRILDDQGKVKGVVVVKKNLDFVTEQFQQFQNCALVSPEGVVFIASIEECEGEILRSLSKEVKKQILNSKQFGNPTLKLCTKIKYDSLISVFLKKSKWKIVVLTDRSPAFWSILIGVVIYIVFSGIVLLFLKLFTSAHQLREAEEKLYRNQHSENLSAMLRSVNHELKSPLQGITGLSEFIKEYGNLDCDKKTLFQTYIINAGYQLDECVKYMSKILDNISLLAKQSTDFDMRYVYALRILVEIIANIYNLSHESEGKIIVNPHSIPRTEIWVSPSQLQQIFLNIINNSFEHGKADKVKIFSRSCPDRMKNLCFVDHIGNIDEIGNCEICSHKKESDRKYIQIYIVDNGNGISPEIQDRIFDPFFTTREVGGQLEGGLGLAIVDRFMRIMKGKVEVFSIEGKGTAFILSFLKGRKEEDRRGD